jgi:hypothetical protein
MFFQKKIITPIILIIAFISCNDIQAYDHSRGHSIVCARECQEALNRLRQIDEIQELVNRVLQEGGIRIVSRSTRSPSFRGMWNGGGRVITINPLYCRTLGDQITTILMELHNASTNKELSGIFRMAAAGRLTIDQFVEQIERMEHKNGLSTCRLLEKGHRMGIFPNYNWRIYENFDDYYMLQQVLGHSLWIAGTYKSAAPRSGQAYRGTVPNIHRLSKQDRDDLCRYLEMKTGMDHPDRLVREEAQKRLSRELHTIRSGGSKSWNASNRLRTKTQFIEQIFKIQV